MSNILLVEDDMGIIEGLEYSLRKNGFGVDTARTKRDAVFFNKCHGYVADLTYRK